MSTSFSLDRPAINPVIERRFRRLAYSPFAVQLSTLLDRAQSRHSGLQIAEPAPDEIELAEISRQLLETLDHEVSLPAMPSVLQRLDEALRSKDCCAGTIAEVVSLDPAIVSRVLFLVNSSFCGLPRKISTVEHGVALLGVEQIRNLVLTTTIISMFTEEYTPSFSSERFWQHSLAVAVGSKLMGSLLNDRGRHDVDPQELFIAGLMHDIGRVLIADQFGDRYEAICLTASEHGTTMYDAEPSILGVRHTIIGQQMLAEWNLTEAVCAAAAFHHDPALRGLYPAVVHCADVIAHGLGFPTHSDDVVPPIDPSAWAAVDLTNQAVESVSGRVLNQVDELTALLQ